MGKRSRHIPIQGGRGAYGTIGYHNLRFMMLSSYIFNEFLKNCVVGLGEIPWFELKLIELSGEDNKIFLMGLTQENVMYMLDEKEAN